MRRKLKKAQGCVRAYVRAFGFFETKAAQHKAQLEQRTTLRRHEDLTRDGKPERNMGKKSDTSSAWLRDCLFARCPAGICEGENPPGTVLPTHAWVVLQGLDLLSRLVWKMI